MLANDTSSTDTQRAQLVTGPSQHNAFRLREDGGFSYTAKADASGSDSFTYRLHDGLQASADATVLITLDDGELSGQDDRFAVVSGDVLALSGPLGILRNDTGTDTAQVTLLERPTYAIDFSLADDGALVYRSVSDTATEDRFTYQLSNAQATLGPFEVTLTIAQPGSTAPAPGTRDYCVSFTAENSVSGTLTATGIANPAFELVSAPKLGSLVAFDPGSGQFSYERQSPAQGADTFSYRILDGEGARVADASAVLIQTPYRVMPVGDSITAGVEFYSAQQGDTPARPQRVGYRQYLKERLTAMGYIIDLVGDSSDGYGVSGFSDHQHNGYPGEDLSYVRDNMSNWLLNTPADVYLMHIGTNGTPNHVNNTMTIANTLDGWEASRNHPATVMMATLITRTDNPVDTAAINNYNALLRDFVVARQAQGDRMHLVDQFTAFGDGSLLSADELHPTTEGYSVMADTWIARLIETGTLRKCD